MEKLIADFAEAGVTLYAVNGTILVKGVGRLTDEMTDAILANKAALLAWLESRDEG